MIYNTLKCMYVVCISFQIEGGQMQNLQIYRGPESVPLTKYKYKATRSFRDLPDTCRKRLRRAKAGDSWRDTWGRRARPAVLSPENTWGRHAKAAATTPGEHLGEAHEACGECSWRTLGR